MSKDKIAMFKSGLNAGTPRQSQNVIITVTSIMPAEAHNRAQVSIANQTAPSSVLSYYTYYIWM